MQYRCRFCHRAFAWETASYQYVRSMIVLHLDRCDSPAAATQSAAERAVEAMRCADLLFGLVPTDEASQEANAGTPDLRRKR